jgi:AcrR family transcriptional regulator
MKPLTRCGVLRSVVDRPVGQGAFAISPRIVDREHKRQQLIEAAARVFASRGFSDTRVANIATEAGVGKGTLYEYFGSKEELFFAVVEWINRRTWERVQEVLESSASARAQLEGLFAVSSQLLAEHFEVHGVTIDFWAASRGGAHEERFVDATAESYRLYRSLVIEVVRRGQEAGEFRAEVDAEAVAAMLVGAFDGLCNQQLFDRSVEPARVTMGFAEALMNGLCTEDP